MSKFIPPILFALAIVAITALAIALPTDRAVRNELRTAHTTHQLHARPILPSQHGDRGR